MKYSVQQIEEALKDGKTIWFRHVINKGNLYKACVKDDFLWVTWDGGETSYLFPQDLWYLEYWICTKIEGEETMEKKTPHKHAELIKLWADTGCQIQYKNSDWGTWHDCGNNRPCWELDNEYRVKPNLVKKWRWVFSNAGVLDVTDYRYTEQEFNSVFQNLTLIQKIDSTMIEVGE